MNEYSTNSPDNPFIITAPYILQELRELQKTYSQNPILSDALNRVLEIINNPNRFEITEPLSDQKRPVWISLVEKTPTSPPLSFISFGYDITRLFSPKQLKQLINTEELSNWRVFLQVDFKLCDEICKPQPSQFESSLKVFFARVDENGNILSVTAGGDHPLTIDKKGNLLPLKHINSANEKILKNVFNDKRNQQNFQRELFYTNFYTSTGNKINLREKQSANN